MAFALKQMDNSITGKPYDEVGPYADREEAVEAATFAAMMVNMLGGGMPEGWYIDVIDKEDGSVEMLTEADLLGLG